MFKCLKCKVEFNEPDFREERTFDYEYWGTKGTRVEIVGICPICGNDEFIEVEEEDDNGDE